MKTSELSALRALDAIGGGRRAGILFSEDAEKRDGWECVRWLPESPLSVGTREEKVESGFKEEAETDAGEDGNGLIVTAAAMEDRPLRNMGLGDFINNPSLPRDPLSRREARTNDWRLMTGQRGARGVKGDVKLKDSGSRQIRVCFRRQRRLIFHRHHETAK